MRRLFALAFPLACACASGTPEIPASSRPAASAQATTTAAAPPARAVGEPPSRAEPGLAPARTYYALGPSVADAEVFHGQAAVLDFGTRGDAKYTLGGWQAPPEEAASLDGTSAAVWTSTRAKLWVPVDEPTTTALRVRVRSFASGPIRWYVNGTSTGETPISAEAGFVTIEVPLTGATLVRGENSLQLRLPGTGAAPGGGTAAGALDWIQVGPPGDSVESVPASFGDAAGAGTLRIPEGWRLGYALEVPAAARLRGTLSGGAIELHAVSEAGARRLIGEADGRTGARVLDVDLGAEAGSLVRLELAAKHGDAILTAPAIACTDDAPTVGERRPVENVIVYLVDTLRHDKLQPYNPSSRVRTPGLSRFVERASALTGAHTQENWTKPSVATLLSGLLPWQHTATGDASVLPTSVELLPEALKPKGFFTGAFIANGYVSDRFGFKQGWDTYRNYIREGRQTAAQYVAADVLAWLDARPQDRPFFLYVHAIDPHVPYRPPAHFLSMYADPGYSGPVSFSRDATLLENIKIGRLRLNEADKRHLTALYDGEISYHDTHFNSILEGLDRRGLSENTMFVLTADHGEEFWDHGSVGHGHSVYEELLHIPMFVRLPGQAEPVRLDDAVGLVDVVPTVLEALGEPVGPDVAGESFLGLLEGRPRSRPRATVSGFMDGWRTIVIGKRKLVHRTGDRWMVFDLAADPREQEDVAGERPVTLRYLRGQLGLALAQDGRPSAGTAATAPAPSTRRAHRAETTEIDAETEAQLRALGYVGTSRRE